MLTYLIKLRVLSSLLIILLIIDLTRQEMVSKVDINNDGIIDICEFIRMMSLQQNPLITPESQLEDIFHIFDKDGSGFITRVCD